jgi:hypothetical protein
MFPLEEREIAQRVGEEAPGDIRRTVTTLMDRIGTGRPLHGFRDFLPPKVLARKKYGFGIPAGEWLRHDLEGLFEDVVSRKNV